MERVSHAIYLEHGNSKGEIRGKKQTPESYSKRVIWQEGRKKHEQYKKEGNPKQGLTSANALTIYSSQRNASPPTIN